MNKINIQKATFNDIEKLQQIGRKTFLETFASDNSEENMTQYLSESFATEKLTNELNNENSAFYFAYYQNNVIGYLKVNFGDSQTEIKDEKTLEIERIYVLKEFHGQKVGQMLYEKALEIAKQNNSVYLWLGVWEENRRAIAFYKKNGFIEFDKHIFRLGNDEQTDIMMKKNLA